VTDRARIAVFGLGEAGSSFAADLARAGAVVTGYDPADVATPTGVRRCATPAEAVADAEIVLALVAAADAREAATQAMDALADGVIYADLGTGSAELKRELAHVLGEHRRFVDVGLMTIVPGNGLATPSLAAGPGARAYVELLTPLGAVAEAVGDEPGVAATRKLLRSVFMKGLAAVVIEAMRGAHAAGGAAWVWDNLTDQLGAFVGDLARRMVEGTGVHHVRRLHEMEAAAELLTSLGVDPLMTRSTVEHLARTPVDGVPELP
jgi:3-hydroxyisobutyrate dehydrogenase-like beta-hydroxyacid dehydrogenase